MPLQLCNQGTSPWYPLQGGGDKMRPGESLDAVENRKILLLQGIEPDGADCYIDSAMPVFKY
jgi:hypothetical protein